MASDSGYDVFRRLADRSDVATAVIENLDTDSGGFAVHYVNPAWEKLTGYGQEWLRQVMALEGAGSPALTTLCQAMRRQERVARELSFMRADGVGIRLEAILEPEAEGLYVLQMKELGSARKVPVPGALGYEKIVVTLNSIGEGVITADNDGAVDYVNSEGERLIGMSLNAAKGQPLKQVFRLLHAERKEDSPLPLERVFRSGQVVGPLADRLLVTEAGIERRVSVLLSPIMGAGERITGCVLVFTDITNQVRLEGELQKNQRMESIALLSGGIAHDFNNILTGILGNISLARNHCEGKDRLHGILKSAEKAAVRARDLTQQLLSFSKGGVPAKSRTSLHELIRETSGFILSGSNCRCQLNVPSDLWPAEVDEGQITQVFNNLLINATQAMKKGGNIEIRAENIKLEANPGVPLEPGHYVRVTVADNGPGIPAESLARIFDPYFTTKKTGSGLGLATTYSIIKNHEGHLLVESEAGAGTSFTFYLPALPSGVIQAEQPEQKLYHGKGRVLLMDDEVMICQIAGDMLTHLGYETEFASDGEEAVRLYEQAESSGNPYSVIIADLTVPGGMGACEMVERLRPRFPQLRCIVTSGYTNNPVLLKPTEHGFDATVQKPYTIQQISWVIRSVLASESSASIEHKNVRSKR